MAGSSDMYTATGMHTLRNARQGQNRPINDLLTACLRRCFFCFCTLSASCHNAFEHAAGLWKGLAHLKGCTQLQA